MMASTVPCTDPAHSPAAGVSPLAVLPLLEAVEALPPGSSGALLYGSPQAPRGVVLIQDNRICWAAPKDMKRRLTELLQHQVDPPLLAEDIERIYVRCREQGLPLGECLVSEGLVTPVQLRRALRQHNSEALAMMSVGTNASPRWVPHTQRGYDARFTFSAPELLVSVGALAAPEEAKRARTNLRRILQSGGIGAAYVTTTGRDPCPVGEVGGDRIGVLGLVGLGSWAQDLLDVSSAVFDSMGFVSARTRAGPGGMAWKEGSILYAALFNEPNEQSCALVNRLREVRGRRS